MKRIVRKRKSRKLREDTLNQVRDTRAYFEAHYPGLLKKAQEALVTVDSSRRKAQDGRTESVDRQKILEMVLKYAATQKGQRKNNLKKTLESFLN